MFLVAGAGFEPATFGLWARRAAWLLYPAILRQGFVSQAIYKIARSLNYIKCFLKNAFPDPVFRYCSKFAALFLLLNTPTQINFIGNLFVV